MNLKQFREATKDMDEGLELTINVSKFEPEYDYEPIEKVSIKKIPFMDGSKIVFRGEVIAIELP